jgi:hypothetical protein
MSLTTPILILMEYGFNFSCFPITALFFTRTQKEERLIKWNRNFVPTVLPDDGSPQAKLG